MANHTGGYLKNLSLSFFQIIVISIFSALLLLISSSLLINEVTHMANYPTMLGEVDLCESLRHVGKQTCGHLQISAVSSFGVFVFAFYRFFFMSGVLMKLNARKHPLRQYEN